MVISIILSFIDIFLLIFVVSWFIRFILKNLWEIQFYSLKSKTINLLSLMVPTIWYVLQYLKHPFPISQVIYILLSFAITLAVFTLRDNKRLNIPHITIFTTILLSLLFALVFFYQLNVTEM